MGRFVRALVAAEIPEGTGRAVSLDGVEVAIFNLGGEFHAIENTCPHRGASLGDGMLEGDEVHCPLHGWQFNVKTGRMPMGGGVRSFHVRVDGGTVFVEI
jgi:nitrite reductase/ring-hydroxylating ferredoxin subunit